MIQLRGVKKIYRAPDGNSVEALSGIDLDIGDGEIFGIIGLSGAGKSTLLRTVNRLEEPSSGKIFIDGREITALDAGGLRLARRKIGMIFQHFNLMPSRTVAGNVAYPLKGSGLSKEDIQKKVATLLELVGLGDFAIRYGHDRNMADITNVTVLVLVLIVCVIEFVGGRIVKKNTH